MEAGQSTESRDPISRNAAPLTLWTLLSRRQDLLGLLRLRKVGQRTCGLRALTIEVCASAQSSSDGNGCQLISRASDVIGVGPKKPFRTITLTSALSFNCLRGDGVSDQAA